MNTSNFDNIQADGVIFKKTTVATYSTAAAITLTPADVLGGLILRNTNGAARADLMPTAASILAAMQNPPVTDGLSFEFTIRNTAASAETITLTANTGVTLSGVMTIAQSNSKTFKMVFAQSGAAVVYSLGTVVT